MDRKPERESLPHSGYCERGCLHPHLHCVILGGGMSPDGHRWIWYRPGFFLPVRVLSRLFRRLFLDAIELAYANGKLQFFSGLEPLADTNPFAAHLAPIRAIEWWPTPNRPSAAPSRCWSTSGDTRIVSP
jgi:hypothetical protein